MNNTLRGQNLNKYRIIIGGVLSADNINTHTGSACFSYCKQYVGKKDVIIEVVTPRDCIRYSDEEIETYIKLINEIPCFKVTYNFQKSDVIFTINCKDYTDQYNFTGIFMIVRYLWGDFVDDLTSYIPEYFLKIDKAFPDNDILYNLLWAHVILNFYEEVNRLKKDSIYKTHWNSNHTLVTSKSIPFNYANLIISRHRVNDTFTKRAIDDTELRGYFDKIIKL